MHSVPRPTLSNLLLWSLLGAACFAVSQIFLRIPLLNSLQKSTAYLAFLAANENLALWVGVLIALSAGLFEEGFRFLFKQFLLKSAKSPYAQAWVFGLGHALCEAAYFFVPLFSVYPLFALLPGLFERFLTVFVHIGLTFIVWNSFQRGRKWAGLFTAILVHGLIDAAIPILHYFKSSQWIWLVLIISALALLAYAFISKKYYREEGIS